MTAAPAPTIRLGDKGEAVERWQQLLVTAGHSLAPFGADGGFGKLTHERTKDYQRAHGLTADGVVGAKTWASVGKEPPGPTQERSIKGAPFSPLVGDDARARVFGRFRFEPAPVAGNPEAIRILDGWDKRNIVPVEVPQVARIQGVRGQGQGSRVVYWHAKGVKQLAALWQAWEDADLLPLVLTWAGSWVPRFIRGSRTTLSNHAYGSAFDINAPWNALGATPADWDDRGTVKPLVELAHEHGFYWGGHFKRADGMHFELARLDA